MAQALDVIAALTLCWLSFGASAADTPAIHAAFGIAARLFSIHISAMVRSNGFACFVFHLACGGHGLPFVLDEVNEYSYFAMKSLTTFLIACSGALLAATARPVFWH